MKKILALLLSLTMVLCMMPSMAFAASAPDGQKAAETQGQEDTPSVSVELTYPDEHKLFYPWTGNAITPELTVKVTPANGGEDVPLNKGDYTASFTDNVNPGTATVTVTVTKEEYNGATGSIKFQIKKSLNQVTLQTPATVTEGTKVEITAIQLIGLTPGTDYDFKSDEDKIITKDNPSVIIEAKPDSDYYGEREVTFTIGISLANAVITIPDLTYTGKEQTAAPSVTVNGTRLYKDTDYTVTGDKATNAGTYTLTITGIGKYAGTSSKAYTVKPKDLKYVTIPAVENQIAGTVPEPKVTDGTAVLVKGTDYTLSNSVTGNKGTLTFTGTGNYTGTVTRDYQIREALDAFVSYTKVFYDYTGYAIHPEVTVKARDPKKTYVLNRDYKIIGGGEVNAGTYTFKVVGIGNYGGEAFSGTYTINRASLQTKGAVSLYGDSFIYTGRPVEPSVTVTCGGRTLVKDVDYTLHYSGNNRIGTASVIVYGKGNYTGSLTKTFRIIGKDISSVSGTLSQSSYKYDGLEKKPAVTLYDGTKKLTAGIDYTVSYRNNRNAGTGEVIVTGKGNYGGTKTLTFRIIGKEQKVTSRYSKYYRTPESDSFNLNADHDGDGYLVYSSSDTSVAEVSSTGRVTVKGTGRAVITVSTAGTVRYEPASKRITIDVRPVTPAVKAVSAAKGKVKVTITKVEGATKYQVKYGRNGKYKNRYITHRDNEYVRIVSTIKNLPSKTHYIKVRAYKTLDDGTKIWGKWVTKKIKVK